MAAITLTALVALACQPAQETASVGRTAPPKLPPQATTAPPATPEAELAGAEPTAGAAATPAPDASGNRTSKSRERRNRLAIPQDPAHIDKAYLTHVLKAWNGAEADVLRVIRRDRTLSPDLERTIRALYTPEVVGEIFRGVSVVMRQPLDDVSTDPGPRLTEVLRVVSARRDCVFMEVMYDFSQMTSDPPSPIPGSYLELRPKVSSQDPAGLNPTPWMVAGDFHMRDFSKPPDSCAR